MVLDKTKLRVMIVSLKVRMKSKRCLLKRRILTKLRQTRSIAATMTIQTKEKMTVNKKITSN